MERRKEEAIIGASAGVAVGSRVSEVVARGRGGFQAKERQKTNDMRHEINVITRCNEVAERRLASMIYRIQRERYIMGEVGETGKERGGGASKGGFLVQADTWSDQRLEDLEQRIREIEGEIGGGTQGWGGRDGKRVRGNEGCKMQVAFSAHVGGAWA